MPRPLDVKNCPSDSSKLLEYLYVNRGFGCVFSCYDWYYCFLFSKLNIKLSFNVRASDENTSFCVIDKCI
jgi:hypothetical protein